jgi:hypothetical protein
MKFIQCEQGSALWFQSRAGVITASTFRDITSTVGGLTDQQSKYVKAIQAGKTEAEALADAGYKAKPQAENIKRALAGQQVAEPSDIAMRLCTDHAIEKISGKPYGEPPNAWTLKRGHELEPHARMAYEQMTGNLALEAGICLTDDGAFGYSTDGLVNPAQDGENMLGSEGLIEIKCPVDSLKIMAIWKTGDLAEYMDQMQGGMWITGAKWCDFIMYVPDLANAGKDLYVKRVHRDDEFIATREKDLLAARQRVMQIEAFLRTPAGNPTRQSAPVVASAPAATLAPESINF